MNNISRPANFTVERSGRKYKVKNLLNGKSFKFDTLQEVREFEENGCGWSVFYYDVKPIPPKRKWIIWKALLGE